MLICALGICFSQVQSDYRVQHIQWKTRRLVNTMLTTKKMLQKQEHQHRKKKIVLQRLCRAMWEMKKRRGQNHSDRGHKQAHTGWKT